MSATKDGASKLIVVESDKVVAAARKRTHSSLFDLAKERPGTALLGFYALGLPKIPGLKLLNDAESEFKDAFRAGFAGVQGVEPVTYAGSVRIFVF